MRYMLVRGSNRYGPYSVDEVRQYLAAGNIAAEDQLEPEGRGAPVTAASLTAAPTGFAAPAADASSASPTPGGFAPGRPMPSPFAGPAAYPAPVLHATIPANVPPPPSMDWWLVLILSLVTCTLFGFIWTFIQTRWVKKLDPSSRATLYLLLSLLFIPLVVVILMGGGVLSALTGVGGGGGEEVFGILFMLLSIVLGLGASVAIIACFLSMGQSLDTVTSSWGAARMQLGGTFLAVVIVGWLVNLLFAIAPVYLQYQIDRVRQFQTQALQGGMAGPRVY